ncbi:MAG: divergent polysaccharide deacetylase family protein [Elusimicrobiota bacterium]|nr:divergent polysaccharide deacetylase family protein [Elusimicrobiota bacterium]
MRSSALLLLLALPAAAEPPRPRLAVVIDDFGFDSRRTPKDEEWAALPFPASFAVMPASPRTRQAAAVLRAAGREVLVHFPFDPFLPLTLPEDALDPQDWAKVEALLERSLREVPGAAGLNNHVSPRATRNRPLMRAFMARLKGRVGFFLDSRVTASSVAYEEARAAGVPAVREYTFLDTDRPGDAEFCAAMLHRAAARARRAGEAVAIGHHYHRATLDCLRAELPRLEASGVELVLASRLAR